MYARRIAALCVVSMLLAVGLIAGLSTLATSKPDADKWPGPFVGMWFSVDPTDDSNQYLQIIPDRQGLYRVSYYDDRASACNKLDVIPAIGYGGATVEATAEGNNLTVDLVWWCLEDSPSFLGSGQFNATYNPDSDTLVNIETWEGDIWITTWTRGHGDMP